MAESACHVLVKISSCSHWLIFCRVLKRSLLSTDKFGRQVTKARVVVRAIHGRCKGCSMGPLFVILLSRCMRNGPWALLASQEFLVQTSFLSCCLKCRPSSSLNCIIMNHPICLRLVSLLLFLFAQVDSFEALVLLDLGHFLRWN